MCRVQSQSAVWGLSTVLPAVGVGLVLALSLAVGHTDARSDGMVGYSGNPDTEGGMNCSNCHYGGQKPTVRIDGPTMIEPDSTNGYTLTIAGGQRVAGGFDVSTTRGLLDSLADATDVQLIDFEAMHTSPKAVNADGEVVFRFRLTAPESSGELTLYGAGNSVNLNGSTSGDAVGVDTLTVMVGPEKTAEPPMATSTPSATATVTATATITPTLAATVPSPGTASPTATPTSTPGGEGWPVYLPVLLNGRFD